MRPSSFVCVAQALANITTCAYVSGGPCAKTADVTLSHCWQTADRSWTCVTSTLKGAIMRKKNLSKNTSYFFRVKPNTPADDYVASLPSPAASLCEVSSQVAALVGGASANLVNARGETVTAASLAGKVVGFYCSASWCGPCRNFTPRLAQVRPAGRL
jgi:hypothetical protein